MAVAEFAELIVEYNCDLCGHDEPRPIEVARPYIGDQEPPAVCGNCGFVYVPHRRSPEEIARAWDDLWQESYTSAWPAVKARLTYVAEWIDENFGLAGKSVLDIGAGEGAFLDLVRQRGAYPVGVEPFAGNVAQIKAKDIWCFEGTIEAVEPGQHNIVTLNWTLENTGDCIGVLEKARDCLTKDGILVVSTGSRILVPFKKPLSSYFSTTPQDTHCFRFSWGSLFNALSQAGAGAVRYNRYMDSDWLVVAGRKDESSFLMEKDDPDRVMRFFRSWAEQFP